MNQERWNEVDRYITDLIVRPDAALQEALDASSAAGLPPIHVSPNEGKLLHILARLVEARNILEIGALGGYSTIWLARALPTGGRLITLEADRTHAQIAGRNLRRAGLGDVVEVIVANALDTLPRLAEDNRGPFDLIFIDADKTNYPAYLSWALRLARVGTLIIADNIVRKGAVADAASSDPLVQAVRRFNELLATDPRLTATVLQTVSGKGYDGFAIALVNATEAG